MFYKYFVSFWSLQPDLTCIAITTQHTSAKTKVIHDAAILYALTSRVRVFLGNIVHHNNINAKITLYDIVYMYYFTADVGVGGAFYACGADFTFSYFRKIEDDFEKNCHWIVFADFNPFSSDVY